MSLAKEKVRGSLLGIAIGDALGMPVEGWSHTRIKEEYPEGIRGYVRPKNHKYFNDLEPGTWTDDTQFTIVMMRALIRGSGCNMDVIAEEHIKGFAESETGAGGSTREAIRLLNNNVHWSQTGKSMDENLGWGNAIPMKIAPLAWFAAGRPNFRLNEAVTTVGMMSHYTKMSTYAGIVQANLVASAMKGGDIETSLKFSIDLMDSWQQCSIGANTYFNAKDMRDHPDSIIARLKTLWQIYRDPMVFEACDLEWAVANLGKGSYRVYDSYPFTIYHLLKNHKDVNLLYDCAAAGGDTDSNASMAGAVLGAIHGMSLFEKPENKHLLDGLQKKDELIALADEFVDKLGIEV